MLHAMNASWFSCFTFLLLIHTVHIVGSVESVIGATVILPCQIGQNPQDVYWRYQEKTVVCDISEGKADFDNQAPAYRGRVNIFPSEINKGNFSIILSNVTELDSGTYTCFGPNIAKQNVELTVKAESGRKLIIPQSTSSPNGACRRRADGLLTFLLGCALLYSLVF